jgi:hypothetical protein
VEYKNALPLTAGQATGLLHFPAPAARSILAAMCNLYSVTEGQQAIRDLFAVRHDRAGNLPPLPAVFPD